MKSTFFNLLIWIVLSVAALTSYGYWYAAIAAKSTAVASLQNQIDTKTKTSDRINAARAAFAEVAGDEAIVQGYFVPETGVVSFIDALEGFARAQGATMKVLSVSVAGSAKLPTLVLSVSVDGGFDAVMRTIGSIEYAPYDLSVSKLALSKSEKDVWHGDLGLIVGSVPAITATSTPATTTRPVSLSFNSHD